MTATPAQCCSASSMAAGRVLAEGTVPELQAASSRPGGNLEAVFLELVAGGAHDPRGGIREIARRRRTARRLG
jgi:hypothetical protein